MICLEQCIETKPLLWVLFTGWFLISIVVAYKNCKYEPASVIIIILFGWLWPLAAVLWLIVVSLILIAPGVDWLENKLIGLYIYFRRAELYGLNGEESGRVTMDILKEVEVFRRNYWVNNLPVKRNNTIVKNFILNLIDKKDKP